MINYKSLQAVENSLFLKSFRKPLYESYSFSKIPQTVKALLTGKYEDALPLDVIGAENAQPSYDQVVLFFMDAFGFKFFEKYQDRYPTLKRFLDQGIVSKLTAQFPSTTAAHVTTLNTGKEVGTTGIYEWFYVDPNVDEVISPLSFSFAGDKTLHSLSKAGITPDILFEPNAFYLDLKAEGIESYIFQEHHLGDSPYTQWMLKGAQFVPFESFPVGLLKLSEMVNTPSSKKRYFYVYFGEIDAMGHRYGLDSEEFDSALQFAFESLEEFFFSTLLTNKKTACLLTADHGMVSVDPKTVYYVNERYPEVLSYLKTNKRGALLAPAGSSRDFFLYVKPEHLETVYKELSERVKEIAHVARVEDLIQEGFFGAKPVSQRFRDRVGNLVVLPYAGESVWWHEKHRFDQHFFGMHGGLTSEEMDIPLLFLAR